MAKIDYLHNFFFNIFAEAEHFHFIGECVCVCVERGGWGWNLNKITISFKGDIGLSQSKILPCCVEIMLQIFEIVTLFIQRPALLKIMIELYIYAQ